PAPEDGFLVRRAHRLLEAGSRPALHPPLAFGPGGVTHGSAIDDAEIRMRGALAITGPRARRAPGKGGIVRDVQDRHVVPDERTAVERRPPAGGKRVRDLVGALVAWNAAVAADVVPRDVSRALLDGRERLPEIAVHHVAAPGRPPAAPPPAVDPVADAADDVGRVGVDGDRPGRPADVPERLDDRGQLHPIVRRVTRAAAELGHLAVGGDDDRAPAPRPRVPFRGPVRQDDDRHVGHGLAYPPPWPGINMVRIASIGDARYKRTEPWRDPTRRTSRPFSRPARGRARVSAVSPPGTSSAGGSSPSAPRRPSCPSAARPRRRSTSAS